MSAIIVMYLVIFVILATGMAAFAIYEVRRYDGKAVGAVTDIMEVGPWESGGCLGRRPYRRYFVSYVFLHDGASYTFTGISRIRKPKCSKGNSEMVTYRTEEPSDALSEFDRDQIGGNLAVTLLIIAFLAGVILGTLL